MKSSVVGSLMLIGALMSPRGEASRCKIELGMPVTPKLSVSSSRFYRISRSFRERHLAQTKVDPSRPYHFASADVYKVLVDNILKRLEARRKKLVSSQVEPRLLDLFDAAYRFGQKTALSGYMYDDVLVFTYWNAVMMSIPSRIPKRPEAWLGGETWRLAKVSPRDIEKSDFDQIYYNHPKNGFYLLKRNLSREIDLVRSRNFFLYTVGIVDFAQDIDGVQYSAIGAFEHDRAQHNSRASTSDIAYMNTRSGSEFVQEIEAQIEARRHMIEVIDGILANSKLSSEFRESYERNLYNLDHEGDTSVYQSQGYVNILLAQFLSNTEETLRETNMQPGSSLKISRTYLATQITPRMKKDFRELYKNCLEFRGAWDKYKRTRRRGSLIYRRITLFESALI